MKKCLILFILVLQNCILWADGYYCKQIGIDNGLSQSGITAVADDGRGALWIGTRFGLNEYRNGKLRSFMNNRDNNVQGTYIYMLHLDSRGALWTSTDKGLFRYDPANDAFDQVSESTVTCAADSEDGIWFGAHFGLKYYSFETGQISGEDGDVYTDYQTLFFHGGHLFSLDRREGLVCHAHQGEESVPIEGLEGSLVMASALEGNILYLSLLNYGLVGFDLDKRQTDFSIRFGEGGLSQDPLLALMVQDNKLWMGFDGDSVWIMDLDTHELAPLDLSPSQSGDRIPLSVTALYSDHHNNIWIGSVRSGVVGLKKSPIKTFSLTSREPDAENVIIWVHSSQDGNIYLGTDGSGIWRYNQDEGLTCLAGKNGLKVTSIADFDGRALCIGTYNRGYFLMDRATSRLTPFVIVDKATNTEECFNSNAPSVHALQDGRLLFLAVNTYLYDPRTRKFQKFQDTTAEDGKELLLIGPSGGSAFYAYSSPGLFTIDLESMRLELIYRVNAEIGTINTAVYHGGLVWFGTNYGLFSFDPRSGQVQKVESGLFSRVSRLESNGADNLWISADNTLFLSRNGVIEVTGENRGVPANEMVSGTCTPQGTIYLGGNAGLVEIGADCFFGIPENRRVELRDPSFASVKLPHNYSSLEISVFLAGADPFERVLYRYIVTGSSDLTYESYEQSLSLPALKPGHYRLRVSYLKSDGTWSNPQDISRIRVMQPWYISVPMILIYIVLFLVATILIIDRVSRQRLHKLEEELRSRDSVFTSKVEEYIQQHISEPTLSVSDIAAQMAMSRATLYYKMNASFGKGVAEVIEERRMVLAEELLSTTSFSVLDISEKVGYSSSRYFSTRFKLLHGGITPLKYRQTHH